MPRSRSCSSACANCRRHSAIRPDGDRRGSRKSVGLMVGPWLSSAMAITELRAGPKQSELPEPETEELNALAILAEPIAGVQTWRTVAAQGRQSQTTTIRQTAERSEFEFEGRL